MKELNFPKNIKQIGGIDPAVRIYVEDYVISYLTQYTTAAGYDERLATLVGKRGKIDGIPVVFISGAILTKYTEEEDGRLVLSDKSHDHIQNQQATYFRGLDIVGFMQSQPGYGTMLNPRYEMDFAENHNEENSIMMVVDPLEKMTTLYIYSQGEVVESNGYFVYYEKNEAMNKYMGDNRIVKNLRSTLERAETMVAAALEPENEVPERVFLSKTKGIHLVKEENLEQEIEQETTNNFPEIEELEMIKEPRIMQKPKTKSSVKAAGKGQKRVSNILTSMVCVMLVISFVMAGALIRSEDRLNQLEAELGTLTSAYVTMIQSLQATQEAFAMASMPQPGNIIEENGAELANDGTNNQQTANIFAPIGGNFPQSYIVQAGDNLLAISQMFYGTTNMVAAIKELNDIVNADMIFQGMVLQLPQP